jgi:hypothetical protein
VDKVSPVSDWERGVQIKNKFVRSNPSYNESHAEGRNLNGNFMFPM